MISVAYLSNYIEETSYEPELASILDSYDDISVTIYTIFEPEPVSYDVTVESFDAETRFEAGWLRELYGVLTSGEYDIFHTHPSVASSMSRIASTLARFEPVLSTEHTTHEWYDWLKRLVVGSTLGLNDVVITNSEWTRDSLQWWEQGLLSVFGTRTEVIYNGVDIDAITAATGDHSPPLPEGFLVGTVGRMVGVKNHDLLLHAGAKLARRHDDIYLVVVGDGEKREDLEALAAHLGITDRVVFTGHLPRSEVYDVLHHLDVFAFPSEHEGFGNAAVEAMAAGVPVVCNEIPALREVVEDAGVFVDAATPEKLADAIDELYRHEETRLRYAEEGRERAMDFTIRRAAEKHAELYRELATGSAQTQSAHENDE